MLKSTLTAQDLWLLQNTGNTAFEIISTKLPPLHHHHLHHHMLDQGTRSISLYYHTALYSIISKTLHLIYVMCDYMICPCPCLCKNPTVSPFDCIQCLQCLQMIIIIITNLYCIESFALFCQCTMFTIFFLLVFVQYEGARLLLYRVYRLHITIKRRNSLH